MNKTEAKLFKKFWQVTDSAALIIDKQSGGIAVKEDSKILTRAEVEAIIEKMRTFLEYYSEESIIEYNVMLHNQMVEAVKDEIETGRDKSGFIYLIKADTGHYKIGRTKELKRRMNLFNVNLPFQIELIHTFPSTDYVGAETDLHHRFAEKRVNGEWFQLSDDEVEWLKLIESYDPIDDEGTE